MALMRRVATLGAAVAAARSYARQNPDKVNRYADRAATFVDQRTRGRYRSQIDAALRQVRKQTSVPGSASEPSWSTPDTQRAQNDPHGTPRGPRSYPSERADRP